MRRDESVFFFTLVDFLLTALFFGLVLVAVGSARAQRQIDTEKKLTSLADSLRQATGISDLTVLTDRLTRLGPLRDAEAAVQVIKDAGGLNAARMSTKLVAGVGGADTVAARLQRLSEREGVGRPHCLFTDVVGRREAIALATVIATDTTLSFERETPQLRKVLTRLGRSYEDVHSMRLNDFRRTFSRLPQLQPTCLYTVDFIERTPYVYARDAVRGIFYQRIRH